ncbi:MAG: class I adenylate-forming enzyme family protein [Thermodesulfobacteriota bacterium]|nr:class I adenylate-forming enzyme family protein [Thermodesulfobacteriota bacterium]
MHKTVHHFLEQSASDYPDKTAVINAEERISYAALNQAANSLSAHLITSGISRGDRVALLMENSVDYVIAYYGILKAGAVAAPLNPGLKPDGLQYLLNDLEPAAVISTYKSERLLNAVSLNDQTIKDLIIKAPKKDWSGGAFRVSAFDDAIADNPENQSPVETTPQDLANIIYTSGSTGPPKGVMLTHGNIVANTLSICDYLELTNADIQMVVLPFFYVMGKSLLNTHIAAGGTVVINNRFLYPADVIKEMISERVTGFSGVPATYAYLLHRSPLAKHREELSALRYCSQAGGHMATQLKKDLRAVLPAHTNIVIMYGATEASARLTYLPPDRFEDKMASIGRAIPGVTLKLVDTTGKPVAQGETGELVANGPNIMQGYWKAPEATKTAIDTDGFYHTGDLATMDEDGFFYSTGRKDNILKVSGHKVNPREIEDCLMQTQKLLEVMVLGIPDDLSGNRLVALCVPLSDEVTESELQQYCHETIPRHCVPSDFTFLKTLPKAGSGKVDNQQCRKVYQQLQSKS